MNEAHDTDIEGQEILFPNGGWDVHHHIFEPSRFPYSLDRHLTPPPASVKQYTEWKSDLGLSHSVLTHGLSYGNDCTSLQSFVPELGKSCTMAIGVIDPTKVTPVELRQMREAAIRGIRVNIYKYNAMHDVERQKVALREHAAVLKRHCPGWSMAFTHTHPEFWGELAPAVEEIVASGIPIVTDHFALLKAASTFPEEYRGDITSQPGFSDIVSLVRSSALYVKISAPYRISNLAPDYTDVRPLVTALVEANPQQILWGSDWPHTPRMTVRSREEALRETSYLKVDDRAWLRQLKSWLTEEQWDLIMVKNPQRLYGGQ
ncbi:uncharacterized protein TrAtP1_002882 [Trichoderma atroviride]|uniref:Amidohydrolase-related domain-containing protein n=1 Tax=Hypocrea atroviridis (strain ATCC 20476 / IMI 206040) TaxID=452589 RepID=G9NXF2_HYPAI|nr:uncharacterized protein TRIATDRAFT_199339 [Trichoderma atroviride IMI 206040]EHK44762.1 hypothetical protein TRIATDRAFT_199339 [Trichoderma atroviride IMI 206040]UKZ61622.1 hypothetical protein TrAtP1_002882 [Trichoderma atroviride]